MRIFGLALLLLQNYHAKKDCKTHLTCVFSLYFFAVFSVYLFCPPVRPYFHGASLVFYCCIFVVFSNVFSFNIRDKLSGLLLHGVLLPQKTTNKHVILPPTPTKRRTHKLWISFVVLARYAIFSDVHCLLDNSD